MTAPTQHSAGFAVEEHASQLLQAPDRQASHSCSDASLASNDGSNSARISVLETRQDELERRQDEIERSQHDLEKLYRTLLAGRKIPVHR
jgi:hypothetical protein